MIKINKLNQLSFGRVRNGSAFFKVLPSPLSLTATSSIILQLLRLCAAPPLTLAQYLPIYYYVTFIRTVSGHMSEEKVTIKTAMKALGVSEKTVYRYLNNGLLTRIKEGHRTYILSSEIRSLRQKQTLSMSGHSSDSKEAVSGHSSVSKESMSGQVSLSQDEYKKLIQENEELKQKNLLLLEHN